MAKATKKAAAKKAPAKTAAKATRIVDTMKIVVVKKENPFTSKVQMKHADACLASNGQTVEAAKKRGCDGWTLRQLVARKLVRVVAVEA